LLVIYGLSAKIALMLFEFNDFVFFLDCEFYANQRTKVQHAIKLKWMTRAVNGYGQKPFVNKWIHPRDTRELWKNIL